MDRAPVLSARLRQRFGLLVGLVRAAYDTTARGAWAHCNASPTAAASIKACERMWKAKARVPRKMTHAQAVADNPEQQARRPCHDTPPRVPLPGTFHRPLRSCARTCADSCVFVGAYTRPQIGNALMRAAKLRCAAQTDVRAVFR